MLTSDQKDLLVHNCDSSDEIIVPGYSGQKLFSENFSEGAYLINFGLPIKFEKVLNVETAYKDFLEENPTFDLESLFKAEFSQENNLSATTTVFAPWGIIQIKPDIATGKNKVIVWENSFVEILDGTTSKIKEFNKEQIEFIQTLFALNLFMYPACYGDFMKPGNINIDDRFNELNSVSGYGTLFKDYVVTEADASSDSFISISQIPPNSSMNPFQQKIYDLMIYGSDFLPEEKHTTRPELKNAAAIFNAINSNFQKKAKDWEKTSNTSVELLKAKSAIKEAHRRVMYPNASLNALRTLIESPSKTSYFDEIDYLAAEIYLVDIVESDDYSAFADFLANYVLSDLSPFPQTYVETIIFSSIKGLLEKDVVVLPTDWLENGWHYNENNSDLEAWRKVNLVTRKNLFEQTSDNADLNALFEYLIKIFSSLTSKKVPGADDYYIYNHLCAWLIKLGWLLIWANLKLVHNLNATDWTKTFLISINGYGIRKKNDKPTIHSSHSLGLAFDLNAGTNIVLEKNGPSIDLSYQDSTYKIEEENIQSLLIKSQLLTLESYVVQFDPVKILKELTPFYKQWVTQEAAEKSLVDVDLLKDKEYPPFLTAFQKIFQGLGFRWLGNYNEINTIYDPMHMGWRGDLFASEINKLIDGGGNLNAIYSTTNKLELSQFSRKFFLYPMKDDEHLLDLPEFLDQKLHSLLGYYLDSKIFLEGLKKPAYLSGKDIAFPENLIGTLNALGFEDFQGTSVEALKALQKTQETFKITFFKKLFSHNKLLQKYYSEFIWQPYPHYDLFKKINKSKFNFLKNVYILSRYTSYITDKSLEKIKKEFIGQKSALNRASFKPSPSQTITIDSLIAEARAEAERAYIAYAGKEITIKQDKVTLSTITPFTKDYLDKFTGETVHLKLLQRLPYINIKIKEFPDSTFREIFLGKNTDFDFLQGQLYPEREIAGFKTLSISSKTQGLGMAAINELKYDFEIFKEPTKGTSHYNFLNKLYDINHKTPIEIEFGWSEDDLIRMPSSIIKVDKSINKFGVLTVSVNAMNLFDKLLLTVNPSKPRIEIEKEESAQLSATISKEIQKIQIQEFENVLEYDKYLTDKILKLYDSEKKKHLDLERIVDLLVKKMFHSIKIESLPKIKYGNINSKALKLRDSSIAKLPISKNSLIYYFKERQKLLSTLTTKPTISMVFLHFINDIIRSIHPLYYLVGKKTASKILDLLHNTQDDNTWFEYQNKIDDFLLERAQDVQGKKQPVQLPIIRFAMIDGEYYFFDYKKQYELAKAEADKENSNIPTLHIGRSNNIIEDFTIQTDWASELTNTYLYSALSKERQINPSATLNPLMLSTNKKSVDNVTDLLPKQVNMTLYGLPKLRPFGFLKIKTNFENMSGLFYILEVTHSLNESGEYKINLNAIVYVES